MCACVGSCVRVWCGVGVVCGVVVRWYVCTRTYTVQSQTRAFLVNAGVLGRGGKPNGNMF